MKSEPTGVAVMLKQTSNGTPSVTEMTSRGSYGFLVKLEGT